MPEHPGSCLSHSAAKYRPLAAMSEKNPSSLDDDVRRLAQTPAVQAMSNRQQAPKKSVENVT